LLKNQTNETILVQDKDGAILDVSTLATKDEGFEVIPVNTCDEEKILELIMNIDHTW
jgi:hypothetical protein